MIVYKVKREKGKRTNCETTNGIENETKSRKTNHASSKDPRRSNICKGRKKWVDSEETRREKDHRGSRKVAVIQD